MPICPGCERKVPYDQLDIHERYCRKIRSDTGDRSLERLERRLTSLETLVGEMADELEAEEQRRSSLEEEQRLDARTGNRTE